MIPGRNPVLYELIDGVVSGHVVDFPEDSWPAGGMNMSVTEMAKLFAAISGEECLDTGSKQQLFRVQLLLFRERNLCDSASNSR